MFHHLMDGETWEVAPYTWKPMEKNLSMEGAISLQNRKVIGKLVFYTHKGNCDQVLIQDILHISWMIVLTEIKPFVLWQLFITRGKIGGIFFSLQEMCFFSEKNVTFENSKITEKKTMRQQV